MGLLSVAALLIAALFLAYNYPAMLKSFLPAWLVPGDSETDVTTFPQQADTPESAVKDDSQASDGDSTPKAEAKQPPSDVPTFTLSENETDQNGGPTSEPVGFLSPDPKGVQRLSAMPPPPRPTAQKSSDLMPPPTRPVAVTMPKQSAATSVRLPTTGPLPNRGPPANSQQRVNSILSPNGAAPTPNARGKVILKPGHSPMDWAALTRSGNLSGVNGLQRVTPSQLKAMTGRRGKPAWSSWHSKVYNITPYLPFHPGGEAELMKAAGRDGTKLFMDVHPWVNWENMLGACLVGVLVPEEPSPLESLD